MPRLFLGNFDFEGELRLGRKTDDLPAGRIARSLRGAWLSLAVPGDVVIGPDEKAWCVTGHEAPEVGSVLPEPVLREWTRVKTPGLEWTPWGWSQASVTAARGWPVRVAAPPLEAVARVNRRSFRAELELSLGIGPAHLAICRSVEDTLRVLATLIDGNGDGTSTDESPRYDWVIKAEYGMAGRQAIRGRGANLSDRDRQWLLHRLRETSAVVVEPWLVSTCEGSLQFDIPLWGAPILRGITLQTVDATGVYRGSQAGCDATGVPIAARFQSAVSVGMTIALRVQEAGYCGPMGVDVMEYVARDGTTRIRALQDLNARYSMGYLAAVCAERLGRAIGWVPQPSELSLVAPKVSAEIAAG